MAANPRACAFVDCDWILEDVVPITGILPFLQCHMGAVHPAVVDLAADPPGIAPGSLLQIKETSNGSYPKLPTMQRTSSGTHLWLNWSSTSSPPASTMI